MATDPKTGQQIFGGSTGAGLNNVGSYQVSGIPFATGSIDSKTNGVFKITFPYVTSWIYVVNHDQSNHCRVGFSSNGVDSGTNYFRLGPQAGNEATQFSQKLDLKLSELYLSGSTSVDVVAGLTTIPTARVDNISLSGSNWSGSLGVG